MAHISTTKMSSKGQVVIPEAIRKKLGLKSGDQFIVTGNKDVVILKSISPPSLDEFDDLIAEARKQARKAGLKRSDIVAALNRVRDKK
ncbi:AbrB/MazE/SpoVT family DNA-binding domain-containing protein [Thermodesulfobacteriota bacterium]